MTHVCQTFTTIATEKDISNFIAEIRRVSSKGDNSVKTLAEILYKEGFWYWTQVNEDDQVTAILFVYPDSLECLQTYPGLFFLDCTDKPNKFGMPLVNFIGTDACQRFVCIAFALLNCETEGDYTGSKIFTSFAA
jgi:hypothetical protein